MAKMNSVQQSFSLILRGALLCVVPVVAMGAGFLGEDVGIVYLTMLACVAEILLLLCSPRGKAARRNAGSLFLLRLFFLYAVQLWILQAQVLVSRVPLADEPRHEGAAVGIVESGEVLGASKSQVLPKKVEPKGTRSRTLLSQKEGLGMPPQPKDVLEQAAERKAPPRQEDLSEKQAGRGSSLRASERGQVKDSQPLTATTGFDIDAPQEALAWSPRTISVVLPCAQESEYALKTVQSVFDSTPSKLLHEIVVVDDGSSPPLAKQHLTPDVQALYKVKLLRHENTVGLIGAKKTGGDGASGDILVFFDCHVAPQKNWYEDFLTLIAVNYRRMVIPDITSLDVNTWTQVPRSGGLSKCYVTWDGDFKWGGTNDMYMGMLSGGLLGMSRRWWQETGGYDSMMMGWGGENIDQGVRVWLCGGEIVAAPNSKVAHMWRSGDPKTSAKYKRVGDVLMNRARAVNAWFGEFAEKLDSFPKFHDRKQRGGKKWFGNMGTFQEVRDRLKCRPFAWYLRRFKAVYEDAGIIPDEIFMIEAVEGGKCLYFQGPAGTSGAGSEGVLLKDCDASDDRFFWHLGNRNSRGECCSGLRAWNTDQCFAGDQGKGTKGITSVCDVSGADRRQSWSLSSEGHLKQGSLCLGPGSGSKPLASSPCRTFQSDKPTFRKLSVVVPLETKLYRKSQEENPDMFRKLNEQFPSRVEVACPDCVFLLLGKVNKCLDDDAVLTAELGSCATLRIMNGLVKTMDGKCLDNWSDNDIETWGFYNCHGGETQQFKMGDGGSLCSVDHRECFRIKKSSK